MVFSLVQGASRAPCVDSAIFVIAMSSLIKGFGSIGFCRRRVRASAPEKALQIPLYRFARVSIYGGPEAAVNGALGAGWVERRA